MGKIALVTGGSSGIGRAAAAALREAGCTVYELSRRDIPAEGIVHLGADVTREDEVRAAVAELAAREGRLDILVSCAGGGISGAAEWTSSRDSHAQMELNLFGMDNAVRAALPLMRAQGAGRIVCLSSIAGILPIPFQLWYSVSKAAVAAYVLALQNELRPFGVTVCAVLPGDVATGFTDARRKSAAGDDVYGGRIERSVARMERDERGGMSAAFAGRFVARAALRRGSGPMLSMGAAYKGAALLAKLLPRRLSNWIIGRMYAK